MKEIKAESGKFCDLVINPEDLPRDCSPIDFTDKSKAFTLKVEQMRQYIATYFNADNQAVDMYIFEAVSTEEAKKIAESDQCAQGCASYKLGEIVNPFEFGA